MRLIKISNEKYKKCVDFANNVDLSLYERRNKSSFEKRQSDTIIGKMGELAAFEALKMKFGDLTEPDFKIYSTKEKSWDYDLKSSDANFHIKTQSLSQGKKYGCSWTFQKEDKHIFKNYHPNDYVVFVSIDQDTRDCFIKSILPVHILHDNDLFKPMKLLHLASKCAIYFDDIQNMESSFA